jgi:hypothetical protein
VFKPVNVEVFSSFDRSDMKAQDPSRIRKQLELIALWRASGLCKAQWATQQGIELKHLMGWLTYEGRWKARLSAPQTQQEPKREAGFVPVHINPSHIAHSTTPPSLPAPPTSPHLAAQPTVRIDYTSTSGPSLTLHWPISHSAQLAHFLGLVSPT